MPRPLSLSPHRKFSSTLASRLKEKDAIRYEAKPKKMRPVSCPPTPTFRFRDERLVMFFNYNKYLGQNLNLIEMFKNQDNGLRQCQKSALSSLQNR